jgi:hypothetical protein
MATPNSQVTCVNGGCGGCAAAVLAAVAALVALAALAAAYAEKCHERGDGLA